MYEDFAEFGLGWAASKFSLTPLIALRASDHSLLLAAPGVASAVEAWNEFEYGKSNGGSVHRRIDGRAGAVQPMRCPYGTRACPPRPCPTRLRRARRHRTTAS